MADIIVHGLTQNNLKHVTFTIPKEKITVFTGVSGSGKSSIVFDTIAAEAQRQMNATYPAFVRSRLPKYPKPAVERIDNLTATVVVDQTPLGGNARSTVGTISGPVSYTHLDVYKRQVVENVKDNLQQNIYKTIIPRNIRLAEAPSYGMPINQYDPKSAGSESYMRLADEVISKGL